MPDAVVAIDTIHNGVFGFADCATRTSEHPTFRITRSDSVGTLSVSIQTGGTAVPGEDYAPPASTVEFPDGVSAVNVTLDGTPFQASTVPARTRTLTMSLAPGTGYSLGTPSSADASITYLVPGNCPPATFQDIPANQYQRILSNQLPEPLPTDPAPPGTWVVVFDYPRYPPGTPMSVFPPPGLSWMSHSDAMPGYLVWEENDAVTDRNSPPGFTPGSYSFVVVACAYYQAMYLYYGALSGAPYYRCSSQPFNLDIDPVVVLTPAFTG